MTFLLVSLFLVYSPQRLHALTKAADQNFVEIKKSILEVNQKTKTVEETVKLMENAASLELFAKYEKKLAELRMAQRDAAEKAIWLTIRAYDIIPFDDSRPIFPNGISVLGSPEKGKNITWLPIFAIDERMPVQDEFGHSAGNREPDPRRAGNTASDGISRIYPSAFNNPAELASIINHWIAWQMRLESLNPWPRRSALKRIDPEAACPSPNEAWFRTPMPNLNVFSLRRNRWSKSPNENTTSS